MLTGSCYESLSQGRKGVSTSACPHAPAVCDQEAPARARSLARLLNAPARAAPAISCQPTAWHRAARLPQGAPRGLELQLGTSRQPGAVDTLVMSNMGYFQLKASPGLWQLGVAPGRSRCAPGAAAGLFVEARSGAARWGRASVCTLRAAGVEHHSPYLGPLVM